MYEFLSFNIIRHHNYSTYDWKMYIILYYYQIIYPFFFIVACVIVLTNLKKNVRYKLKQTYLIYYYDIKPFPFKLIYYSNYEL